MNFISGYDENMKKTKNGIGQFMARLWPETPFDVVSDYRPLFPHRLSLK